MRADEHAIIDHRPGRYYVTVRDGDRHGYLLGPYDSHLEALENVDRGNRLAGEADGRAHWYAFGTGRLADDTPTVASVFGR
jgi:hypothetical protein